VHGTKRLKGKVRLEIFIKEGENDPFNAFSTFFCVDLTRLSDKIKMNLNMIGDEKSKEFNIEHSPTILINPDDYNIRYVGAPAGEEGRSFIETIIMVSNSESGLSAESKKELAGLAEPRHIQVFVTPGCPYCPEQVINAFRAAIERSDLIKAECIEATPYSN
jgi:thioredoxin reductase (NADPH)